MNWRLLTADGVSAAEGLATDEVLCRNVGIGTTAPSLRLYTYRSHCALVGRFQDLRQELQLDYCQHHGVQVNRRPTGGGAILMGRDQLGIALALSGRGQTMNGRPRELMQRFSLGIRTGLEQLGVSAEFRGKNDLEVGGRKIAGLGIYRDANGGLLLHGSLLVDLDVALMARVLQTPFDQIGARELRIIDRRTTTVRQQRGDSIRVAEVRQTIAGGFARTFGVELLDAELTATELAAIDTLSNEKYRAEAWLQQTHNAAEHCRRARLQTSAGLLHAQVALAGKTIKSVLLQGDFFANEDAIVDLEARLRWHPVDADAIAETVREWAYATPTEELDPQALHQLLVTAIESDPANRAVSSSTPYGCFVNPGSQEASKHG